MDLALAGGPSKIKEKSNYGKVSIPWQGNATEGV